METVSLALDLETELVAVGEGESCIFRVVIFYVDIAINSPMQVNMNNNGSEHLGNPTN
jgi:hypothetical protein